MIWVETGAGRKDSFRQTCSSTDGSMVANVPTAPESFPTEITSRERLSRAMFRRISSAHRATFVPNVGAGQPVVEEPRVFPDVLGDRGEKGDDVVLHPLLDFVDPGDVELRVLADPRKRIGGNPALPGHRLHRENLDVEPDPEAVPRLPDFRHLGRCVSLEHGAPLPGMPAPSLAP